MQNKVKAIEMVIGEVVVGWYKLRRHTMFYYTIWLYDT